MFGLLYARILEMTPYTFDTCPKCGREGCTCDPDNCDCELPENGEQDSAE